MTGPPPKQASDAELVLLARSGSRPALEALFRRHARVAHGLAYRLLGRRDEAEEVAQDALAASFRSLHQLREPERFSSWLRGICVRKCRSRIRNLKVRRRLGFVDAEPLDLTDFASPDVSPETLAELRMLARCMESLAVEEQMALVLVRVEGMTLPDVAEHLGKSLATVKRRLARAEERLKKLRREPSV